MFLLTPDADRREAIGPAVRDALRDLTATFHEIRGRRPLFRFMLARMLYQDGINGLLVLGGAFAAGMFGWSITEVGLFGIILNITAILGCLVAGFAEARLGSKRVVEIAISCLIVATLGIVSTAPGSTLFGLVSFAPTEGTGLFATPAERAYLGFGLLIGLAFGPVQASSRAWLAKSVTPEEAGTLFRLLRPHRKGHVLPRHALRRVPDGRRRHADRSPDGGAHRHGGPDRLLRPRTGDPLAHAGAWRTPYRSSSIASVSSIRRIAGPVFTSPPTGSPHSAGVRAAAASM